MRDAGLVRDGPGVPALNGIQERLNHRVPNRGLDRLCYVCHVCHASRLCDVPRPTLLRTMPLTPTPRKPRRITGSGTITVRLHNRVLKKLRPAARRAGLTKNGLVARAVEQYADAVLTQAA